jgi:perosamine synthetase
MDASKIEEKITIKTKAIMAVHIYGHPCDMNKILKIAKKHKLLIIEDAAEVHGATYKNKLCGGFGDISCFSFYGNKIITTGEGGMVITSNKKFYERAKFLRNLGFNEKKRFFHTELARNYRMTNLQAAIGCAQLKNIEKLIKIKRDNARKYTELLKDIKGLQLPAEKSNVKNVYWMYGIVLDKSTGFTAEKFAKKLAEKGIQTRPFFYPLHLQPVWKKMGIKIKKEKLLVAENIAKQGLYLPSGLALKDLQIEKICYTIKKLLKHGK